MVVSLSDPLVQFSNQFLNDLRKIAEFKSFERESKLFAKKRIVNKWKLYKGTKYK